MVDIPIYARNSKNGNSSRVQFINDLVKCVKKTRSYFFYSLNAGFWRPLSKNWLAIYDMRKNPHFCQYISENLLTKKLKKKLLRKIEVGRIIQTSHLAWDIWDLFGWVWKVKL